MPPIPSGDVRCSLAADEDDPLRSSSAERHGDPVTAFCMDIGGRRRHTLDGIDRKSAPQLHLPGSLSRRLSAVSASQSPETALSRVSCQVLGFSLEDDHYVYRLQVDLGNGEQTIVQHRFSDFRNFRFELTRRLNTTSSHCGMGPCRELLNVLRLQFPWRGIHLTKQQSVRTARRRLKQLQLFADAVLATYREASRRQSRCCLKLQCGALDLVRDFFSLCLDSGPLKEVGSQKLDRRWSMPANNDVNEGEDGALFAIAEEDDIYASFEHPSD